MAKPATGTTPSISTASMSARCSPPSSATTTTPCPPTSRSTRWPVRRRRSGSPATPRIEQDIRITVNMFQKYYLDPKGGGYYSHVDPITFSPHAESLGPQPFAQELELCRRPRAGLPDQRRVRHGRPRMDEDARVLRPTSSRSASRTTRTARLSTRSSTRTGATTRPGAGSRTARWWATTSRSPGTCCASTACSPRTAMWNSREDCRADARARHGPPARWLVRRGEPRTWPRVRTSTGSLGMTARRGGSRSRASSRT